MTRLSDLRTGQVAIVDTLGDENTEVLALRMGLAQGETIQVMTKIPKGPMVIKLGGLELAIGYALCQQIKVINL